MTRVRCCYLTYVIFWRKCDCRMRKACFSRFGSTFWLVSCSRGQDLQQPGRTKQAETLTKKMTRTVRCHSTHENLMNIILNLCIVLDKRWNNELDLAKINGRIRRLNVLLYLYNNGCPIIFWTHLGCPVVLGTHYPIVTPVYDTHNIRSHCFL